MSIHINYSPLLRSLYSRVLACLLSFDPWVLDCYGECIVPWVSKPALNFFQKLLLLSFIINLITCESETRSLCITYFS